MGCGASSENQEQKQEQKPVKKEEAVKKVSANSKYEGRFTVANISNSLVGIPDSKIEKLTDQVKVKIIVNGGKGETEEYDAPIAEGQYSIKKNVNVDLVDLGASDIEPPKNSDAFDYDAINIGIIVLPTDGKLGEVALKWVNYAVDMQELTLVLDANSGLDAMEVAKSVANSDALLSGALVAHLQTYPRLHFAKVVKNPAQITGEENTVVITAAIFGDAAELTAFDRQANKMGGDRWNMRASVHTYVGHGLQESDVVDHWEKHFGKWETTLWAGEADVEVSLVVDATVFAKIEPAAEDLAGAEEFNYLKQDHADAAAAAEDGDDDDK